MLDDCDIIEKELKEYEEMKAIKGTTTFDKAIEDTLINTCPNVAKKLKALEIIKRTAMKLVSLEDSESGICFNGRYAIYDNELYQSIDITKEEYDLLKEVLEH